MYLYIYILYLTRYSYIYVFKTLQDIQQNRATLPRKGTKIQHFSHQKVQFKNLKVVIDMYMKQANVSQLAPKI